MPMSPRLLRPILSGDPDALRYIAAVQQADQQSLEPAVRKAITDFVVGCKADGIWDAIKASCILMGARTLSGALTPLKGGAPTNVSNNFVSGDYNRKTGLVGNATNKELDTGRANNADPQNNQHVALWVHSSPSGETRALLSSAAETGRTAITNSSGTFQFRSRNTTAGSNALAFSLPGFLGISRSSSAEYVIRHGGANVTETQASQSPGASNVSVYNTNGGNARSASRIAFYSIGESLSLALLDSRVTRLYEETQFAINTGVSGSGYDIDTLRYINAGYAAGGSLA
jgi:hypothetical protein